MRTKFPVVSDRTVLLMKMSIAFLALAVWVTGAAAQTPILWGSFYTAPNGNCGLTVGIVWNDTATASGFFSLSATSNIQQLGAFNNSVQVNTLVEAYQFDDIDPFFEPRNDSFWLVESGGLALSPWTIAVPPFGGVDLPSGNPGSNTYSASYGTGTSSPVSGTTPILQLVTNNPTTGVNIVGRVSRLGRDYDIDQIFTAQVATPGLFATGGDAGHVRIGTTGALFASATHDSFCNTPISGTYPSAAGEFAGGGTNFDISPGATVLEEYTYIPIDHGTDSQTLTITSNAENPAIDITLTGRGCGPEFGDADADDCIDVGNIFFGAQSCASLTLTNTSPDADSGALTDLTITSLTIVGDNGVALWSAAVADGTLSVGESTLLTVCADYNGIARMNANATLIVGTDVGAALAGDGADFSFQLKGFAIPEPSSMALAVLGAVSLAGLVTCRRIS